ncbi:MAG TPA: hypothetical protein VKE40_20360 [Gemmataceae bacterium]|nr:hypothetical protein [Gemmataceae bacterium]
MPLEIISIELTNRCAKACWFCYNHSLPEGETRWSVEEVVGFVRNCAANGVEERVAYVAADGVTVRPIRGKERLFPDFIRRVRATWPDVAAQYRFEGNED